MQRARPRKYAHVLKMTPRPDGDVHQQRTDDTNAKNKDYYPHR